MVGLLVLLRRHRNDSIEGEKEEANFMAQSTFSAVHGGGPAGVRVPWH
ncbi:MAG TPA: hypothetical protein VEJ22_04315 [Nitrospirota bacterium]|nr:hypothetical protein [Nitrospirota bacterium]